MASLQGVVIKSSSAMKRSHTMVLKKNRPAMSDTITVGMDLEDMHHIAVIFDAEGNELEVGSVTNTNEIVDRSAQTAASVSICLYHETD